MQETLPSKQDLYYLVDKLPSKTVEKVWRYLIDRTRLAESLKWLKLHNPLYAEVAVELAGFVDPELYVSPSESHTADDDNDFETKTMLLHEPDKYESSHYTVENVSWILAFYVLAIP